MTTVLAAEEVGSVLNFQERADWEVSMEWVGIWEEQEDREEEGGSAASQDQVSRPRILLVGMAEGILFDLNLFGFIFDFEFYVSIQLQFNLIQIQIKHYRLIFLPVLRNFEIWIFILF